MIITVNYWF